MKDRPERQQLEEALKDEQVGSPKIQALAEYCMLKEVEYRLNHRSADIEEFELTKMEVRKVIIEQAIEQRKFSKDAYAYSEAFANAGVTLAPYFEKYNGNPGQVLLDDLREINRGKGIQ
jgi:hypothetical protein